MFSEVVKDIALEADPLADALAKVLAKVLACELPNVGDPASVLEPSEAMEE